MSPHVVPKASLGPAPDEERTAVDSSWEEEQSTIDQAEMAEKVRRALLEKRRAATGNTTATTGETIEEPTVEEHHRAASLELVAEGAGRLIVEAGPDAGRDFPLKPGGVLLVGRAIDNHVVLTDLSVSRKHFELRWDGAQWVLTDRGSGNGTLLNGKLEGPTLNLRPGDRIEIGHTVFRFELFGHEPRSWTDEEPSTLAGRRASGSGARPSAIQTSEFQAPSPQDSIPLRLERKRGLPPPNGHPAPGYAAPSAPGYAAPSAPGYAAPAQLQQPSQFAQPAFQLSHVEDAAPGGAQAPAMHRPRATLPGRPPFVGPQGSPSSGGMIPPRASSIPADMVPMMPTAPQPRQRPMSTQRPLGAAQPSAANLPMHARAMMPTDTSGISVPAHRFAQVRRPSIDELVPNLSRRSKTTFALIAGGVVLLVAVMALAMGASDELGAPTSHPTATPIPSVTPIGTPPTTPGSSAEQVPADPAPTQATAPSQAAVDQAAAPDQAAVDQAAAEKAAADKLLADKAAADQAAAEKAAADKLLAEKAAADQAAAEKLAADKAAADKAAADKAAADKAAADKLALARATKPKQEPAKLARKPPDKPAKAAKAPRDLAGESTRRESNAELLDQADDLYRRKNFSGAAALLRDAMRGRSNTRELQAAAQIYEALRRTYTAGTAPGAKATDAYTNLRSASRYDDKLGKAHSDDIGPRISAMAPRAAAQFVALKQYEDAFQALRDAERGGSTSSTLAAVRAAIEAHASDLYNQAQNQQGEDPAAARALYRRVLKIVESGSSLHSRATKALNET
ncbi:MAG: FHA domain-containing protein [Kofleriaceae bacterium]